MTKNLRSALAGLERFIESEREPSRADAAR